MEELRAHDPIWKTRCWIAFNALQDAAIVRTSRILDRSKHKDSRSFLWLIKKYSDELDQYANDNGVDLGALTEFIRNINTLRDLTLGHITTKALPEARQLYKDNPVQLPEWDFWLRFIWDFLSNLYPGPEEESLTVADPEF
jgi:hypothetical protein